MYSTTCKCIISLANIYHFVKKHFPPFQLLLHPHFSKFNNQNPKKTPINDKQHPNLITIRHISGGDRHPKKSKSKIHVLKGGAIFGTHNVIALFKMRLDGEEIAKHS